MRSLLFQSSKEAFVCSHWLLFSFLPLYMQRTVFTMSALLASDCRTQTEYFISLFNVRGRSKIYRSNEQNITAFYPSLPFQKKQKKTLYANNTVKLIFQFPFNPKSEQNKSY